ncbi:unnamed protein product [Rotaria magnacalcarata]
MKNIVFTTVVCLTLFPNANGFVYPNDGVFANPSDVHSFYQCSSSTSYLIHCPAGLVRNDAQKKCDWKVVDPIIHCAVSNQPNCREKTRWTTDGIVIVGVDSKSGSDSQHLNSLLGIFVDTLHGNNVYVADRSNNLIQMFLGNSLSSGGITVARGNGTGSNPNQLSSPLDVYVDKNENIYIADDGNQRIQMRQKGATSGITVAGGNGGDEELNKLNILKFTNGSSDGIIVAGQQEDESSAKILSRPTNVFVDDCETLYVAVTANDRIQKACNTVAGGYGEGSNASQFNQPWTVKLDQYNNMYIVDTFNGRIQKWRPNDSAGVTIIGGNGFDDKPNQLWFSYSLALDSEGNIFVNDLGNHRIQKFNVLSETNSY